MDSSSHHQQQQHLSPIGGRAPRRGSTASTTSVSSNLSSVVGNGSMTEDEQESRRHRIKEIMKDPNLNQKEKSLAIQFIMDGRRRASMTSRRSSMGSACSDGDGDALMSEAGASHQAVQYGYNNYGAAGGGYRHSDERSIASSVTSFSDHEQDYPAAPSTPMQQPPPGATYRQFHGRSHSLQDWNDTDRQHAAANFTVLSGEATARLMEQSRPVCEHYERNCTMVAPCCGLAFGCRICHDDCPHLPPPLNQRPAVVANAAGVAASIDAAPSSGHLSKVERRRSMPVALDDLDEDEAHHLIDRFAVTEVICRQCYRRQHSKSNNCIQCGVQFGEYHCNICNLWMSDKESPYHCAGCGFCRVGGRENFRHCSDCGMCIDTLLFDDHNCKSGKYMSDCPICQEDLFSSRFASHEMPCGHAIHWHCFKELTSYDTRCPVCKKTAESPEQMAATWSAIAMGIALQPVPPDMARVVNIVCNDCESSDSNRRWHFLGVRCMECLSFNTSVEQIVMQGVEAAEFLDEIEAAQASEGGVPANISMPAMVTTTTSSHNNNNNNSSSHNNLDEDVPSAQGTSGSSQDETMSET